MPTSFCVCVFSIYMYKQRNKIQKKKYIYKKTKNKTVKKLYDGKTKDSEMEYWSHKERHSYNIS